MPDLSRGRVRVTDVMLDGWWCEGAGDMTANLGMNRMGWCWRGVWGGGRLSLAVRT